MFHGLQAKADEKLRLPLVVSKCHQIVFLIDQSHTCPPCLPIHVSILFRAGKMDRIIRDIRRDPLGDIGHAAGFEVITRENGIGREHGLQRRQDSLLK